MAVIELDASYGLCVLNVVLAFVLLMFKSIMVGVARKRYGVSYPDMYAIKGVTRRKDASGEGDRLLELTDADCDAFNCYQRAHQNTLENLTMFLAVMLLGGLKYPITSAIGGFIWIVGRLIYALGYYTGNPDKRMWGSVYAIGVIVCWGCSIGTSVHLLGQWGETKV